MQSSFPRENGCQLNNFILLFCFAPYVVPYGCPPFRVVDGAWSIVMAYQSVMQRLPHGESAYFLAFAHPLNEVPVVFAHFCILSWPDLLARPRLVKFAFSIAV